MQKYDIAAYIWPSYTGKEFRARQFWPDGIGEWQTVMSVPSRMPLKPADYEWDRKPIWGCCDEADPKVMEMQINEAVRHGVNVFIYDWYWYDRRPFLEQCLDEGFLGAPNNEEMKFYLMWANHDAGYTWDTRLSDLLWRGGDPNVWLGSVDRVEFEKVVHRIIEKYFSRPNYYKINGKPLFMIYDVDNLVKGLGGMEATKDALEWFREECVKAGHPGLELQLTGWGERMNNVSGVDGNKFLSTKEELKNAHPDRRRKPIHYPQDFPINWVDIYNEWRSKAITKAEAIRIMSISSIKVFDKLVNCYEDYLLATKIL